MLKKARLSICLVIIMALFASVVKAQEGQGTPRPTPTNIPPEGSGSPPTEIEEAESKGSIRGTVYKDENADGSCAGEPALAGVPIKFVSDRGDTSVYLQSGENGTYGLVAAGLGTWTVTAEPGPGMIVTSKNPVQAFILEDSNLILGVNFCVAEGASSGTSSSSESTGSSESGESGSATVILPTAGAAVAPSLVIAGASGLGLILAGAGFELNRRRNIRKKKREMAENTRENANLD